MRILCTGANASVTEMDIMASGAINYYTAIFTFADDDLGNSWDSFIDAVTYAFSGYAVFYGSGVYCEAALTYDDINEYYTCDVPWEVLAQAGDLYVGVFGALSSPSTVVLATDMAYACRVPAGASSALESGTPSSALANAVTAAATVEAALANAPYISEETGTWFEWDDGTEAMVDTTIPATGYSGSQGIQGVIGYTGSQGEQGILGYTGSQGEQGIQGNIGVTGYTGSEGSIGLTGYTGSQGSGIQMKASVASASNLPPNGNTEGDARITNDTGHLYIWNGNSWDDSGQFLGYTGSQGNQGEIGYTGSQGSQGETGYNGSVGSQGEVGYTGSQGIIGETGYDGSTGLQGDTGYTGSQGNIGYTGSFGTIYYGTSSTAGNVTIKAVTISGYTLLTGDTFLVVFDNSNTAASAKLSINSATELPIYLDGAIVARYAIPKYALFRYNGTQYDLLNPNYVSLDTMNKVTRLQGTPRIIEITTSRDVALTDIGNIISVNATGAVIVTLPLQAEIPFAEGDWFQVYRRGAGSVTIAIDAGGTLECVEASKIISDRYTSVVVTRIAENYWAVEGRVG